MFNKKGQAAMEFLMTYGWAILVVLVAIGALAYFGVLSPEKFLPSSCTLPSGLACVDHKATSSTVTLVVQNGLGYDLTNVTVIAGGCGSSAMLPSVLNGDKKTFAITCGTALIGSKYSAQVNVSYVVTDTQLSHNKIGSITTKIE